MVDQKNSAKTMSAAIVEHQAGHLKKAEALYLQILEQNSGDAEALHLLGLVAQQKGELDRAVALIHEALANSQTNGRYHLSLGNVLKKQGKLECASECYLKALRYDSSNADAHYNLGTVYHAQQKVRAAAACYREAVSIEPNRMDAYFSLGVIFESQGQLDAAAHCYRHVIDHNPSFVEAINNLGSVLQRQGKMKAASELFHEAARLRPNCPEIQYNIGVLSEINNDFGMAEKSYRRALILKPDYADAHNNLGNVIQKKGGILEAIQRFEKALSLNPDHPWAHFNRAIALLSMGDFAAGWPEYEWRFRVRNGLPDFGRPRWNGEPLSGETILVHCEQGFGDTIQFARYISLLKERGAKVILACQKELFRLINQLPGIDLLIAKENDGYGALAFDMYIPLLSLPGALGTTVETIPCDVPYITPNPEYVHSWASRLGQQPFKVGLVWSSGPSDPRRDCPLSCFHRLVRTPRMAFYSLQKGAVTGDTETFVKQMGIIDLTAYLWDFADTASLISNLDLVITVDTAVAHLAGAMGKSVWTLLPFRADWRWLIDREDSPWYPTMRLFRQQTMGNWHTVIEKVTEALENVPLPDGSRPCEFV